ncbi:hypothetical protein J6590_106444 [Homalodisca vitripennis]|nr:hypothetical protein J6590_106444 [Homalodisca vitripennis]
MLPAVDLPNNYENEKVRVSAIDDSFKELLKTLRHGDSTNIGTGSTSKPKKKRTKVPVTPAVTPVEQNLVTFQDVITPERVKLKQLPDDISSRFKGSIIFADDLSMYSGTIH